MRPSSRPGPLTNVPQAEVQQEIQRFAGRFTERVTQAAESLADDAVPAVSQLALRQVLLYETNALDIATGPVPDVNLLDALVFITLVRDAFDRHWGPQVFGARSDLMLEALATSEKDAWDIAQRLLPSEQRTLLRSLIEAWEAGHPEQVRVEAVRLSDFAALAGDVARASQGGGLLANVKGATQTADQALLFGERALFLAQRTPSILRLQVRLGAQETLADGLRQLDRTEAVLARSAGLLSQLRELEPLLERASGLTDRGVALAHDGRLLLESAKALSAPLFAERPQEGGQSLTALETLAETCARISQTTLKSLESLQQVSGSMPSRGQWTAVKSRLEWTVLRLAGYAAGVGVIWAVAFWTGYYLLRGRP